MKRITVILIIFICASFQVAYSELSNKEKAIRFLKNYLLTDKESRFIKDYYSDPEYKAYIKRVGYFHVLEENKEFYKRNSCFGFRDYFLPKDLMKYKDRFFYIDFYDLTISTSPPWACSKEYYRIYKSKNNFLILSTIDINTMRKSIANFNIIPDECKVEINENNIIDYINFFMFSTSSVDINDAYIIVTDYELLRMIMVNRYLPNIIKYCPEVNLYYSMGVPNEIIKYAKSRNLVEIKRISSYKGKKGDLFCVDYISYKDYDSSFKCKIFIAKNGHIIDFEYDFLSN